MCFLTKYFVPTVAFQAASFGRQSWDELHPLSVAGRRIRSAPAPASLFRQAERSPAGWWRHRDPRQVAHHPHHRLAKTLRWLGQVKLCRVRKGKDKLYYAGLGKVRPSCLGLGKVRLLRCHIDPEQVAHHPHYSLVWLKHLG